jgi:hypothetical protein
MAVTPFEAQGIRAELHSLKRPARQALAVADWDDPDVPWGALTAYAVHVNGERIGVVWSKRGTSHRKSGRLITSTSHPTEWGGTLVGWWSPPARMGRGEWTPVTPEQRFVAVEHRQVGGWQRGRAGAADMLLRTWQELTEDG